MSAIFADTFIKLLTHTYIYLICRELQPSKHDIVWMDTVRYLKNNTWIKIFLQKETNLRKITQQKQGVGLNDPRIQEVFLYALRHRKGFLGCPMQDQELDLMIFMGSFKPRIFCDSKLS